jgi:acyl-CoA thioesterase FadM
LTYLERQKCYGLDKKILFRKTIIWPWLTLRSKYHEGHYDMRHPHTWMILFKNNYLTLRSMVKVQRRSLRYATHRLMVMHPHTKYHWPISKDKNVMARTRKYYLKNHYLTLKSKVKVPQRSLWYATHRLMVMHPHTKYHWPISKDKNVMARTRKYYLKNNYLTLRSKSHKGHYGMWHTALWSFTHILEWYYLKNNYLTLRSKVKVQTKVIMVHDTPLMVMHPHTKYHW